MKASNNPPPGLGSLLRLLVLGVFAMLAFITLARRLYHVQVVENAKYQGAQNALSFRRVRLPATRGRILDRNGVVLADNEARYCAALYLDELRASGPWSNTVAKVSAQIALVGQIIGRTNASDRAAVDTAGIWAHLYRRRPVPLEIYRDLTMEEIARLVEWPEPLAGTEILVRQNRRYPGGDMACHIIGYVGKGTPVEMPPIGDMQRGPDERGEEKFDFLLPDLTGRDGLEKAFDHVLAGSGGYEILRIDAVGYKRATHERKAPRHGADIALTIDSQLQKCAEDALEHTRATPLSGAVVVFDAQNGDVLALASAPRYDLSDFVPALKPEVWNRLMNDPSRPLYGRALSGLYPPGSIIKPLVGLEAMRYGKISDSSTYHCPGYYEIGNKKIRCSSHWGHGNIAVREAIERSCNPFFMDAGVRVSWTNLCTAYSKIGFGKSPVLGIPAAAGVLPSDDWKRRRVKDRWREVDTAYSSIGQGYLLVSPFQAGYMCLTLANGGKLIKPRLVRDCGDGVLRQSREEIGSMEWSRHSMDSIRWGMYDAINTSRGTGRGAMIPGICAVGKTGTAEFRKHGETHNHVWMIAFVYGSRDDFDRARLPRYAITVMCEDSDAGGKTAAAVLKRVMKHLFKKELDEDFDVHFNDIPEEHSEYVEDPTLANIRAGVEEAVADADAATDSANAFDSATREDAAEDLAPAPDDMGDEDLDATSEAEEEEAQG